MCGGLHYVIFYQKLHKTIMMKEQKSWNSNNFLNIAYMVFPTMFLCDDSRHHLTLYQLQLSLHLQLFPMPFCSQQLFWIHFG